MEYREIRVDDQQKYTVYLGGNIGLVKIHGNIMLIDHYKDNGIFSIIKRRLTKKEIMDYDKRYFPFAKEVTG